MDCVSPDWGTRTALPAVAIVEPGDDVLPANDSGQSGGDVVESRRRNASSIAGRELLRRDLVARMQHDVAVLRCDRAPT